MSASRRSRCWCFVFVLMMCAGVEANDLLIANDATTDEIQRYNSATGAFIGSFLSTPIVSPTSMAYGPDGNLYVASSATHSITRYAGQTGQFLGTLVPSQSGGLNNAFDMTFGPDGNLYVAERNKGILRYSGATGAFLGAWGTTGTNALTWAQGVTFAADGKMYVADDHRIKRFDAAGVYLNDFPNATGVEGVEKLRFGPDGNLYVPGNGGILRFNGGTGAFMGRTSFGHEPAFREDGKMFLSSGCNMYIYDWKTNITSSFIPCNNGHLSNATVVVVMVPEPSMFFLGALGAMILCRRR